MGAEALERRATWDEVAKLIGLGRRECVAVVASQRAERGATRRPEETAATALISGTPAKRSPGERGRASPGVL